MPLFIIVRYLLSIASWAILGSAAWFLWTWYHGDYIRDAYGVLHFTREPWRLGAGIAVIAWSFTGGIILRPLLAKPDRQPLQPHRGNGEVINGANESKLYVEMVGPKDAPCIVLTHGWGLDSTIWAYAKRELARDFRLVLWDLPGMGSSRAGPDGIHLTCFAEDLIRIIDYSGAARVVLVGHSIGGMTIETLARDHSDVLRERVAGVVLINTTYTNPLKTMVLSPLALATRPLTELILLLTAWFEPLAMVSAWQGYLNGAAHIANRLGFGPHVTRSQLQHTAYLSTRNSQRAQALGNLSMFRWDASDAFALLETPVLVLGGKKDILTCPNASLAIASSARNSHVELIADANHMGFVERSETYNKAIVEFAARVQGSEGSFKPVLARTRRVVGA